MGDKDWQPIDTAELLRRRQDQHEQTTSVGVGGYEKPLGEPLRPPIPPYEPVPPKKKIKPKR